MKTLVRTLSLGLLVASGCLALAAVPAKAAVSVTVRVAGDTPPEDPVYATLTATPMGGLKELANLPPRQKAIEVPFEGTLDLDPDLVWRLEVSMPGFWARPRMVGLGPSEPVILTVVPTGAVVGTLTVPAPGNLPAAVALRFRSSPDAEGPHIEPAVDLKCPIREGVLECSVPKGKLDLKVIAPGFVPHYFWGVRVEVDRSLALGELPLRAGASVSGQVTAAEGLRLDPSCQVILEPQAAESGSQAERQRRRGLAHQVTPDAQGFFQIVGVPPGQYSLRARQDRAESPIQYPLTVVADSETKLRSPLELHPPMEVRVRLFPADDIYGEPWRVTLHALSPVSRRLTEVIHGETVEGVLKRSGVVPGLHVLQIRSSSGAQVLWEEVEIRADNALLEREIASVPVAGKLLLGTEPLAGSVWFGGRRGAERIEMVTDEEGSFFGILPRDGSWRVSVESTSPSVRRTLAVAVEAPVDGTAAWVELRLPGSELVGVVVDGDREPVAEAVVEVMQPETREAHYVITAEDGTFQLAGFEKKTVLLHASATSPYRISDAVRREPTKISQGEPIELILREVHDLRGKVVGPRGPVAGARILGIPRDLKGSLNQVAAPDAVSAVDGTFHLRFSAATESLSLIVLAPGFALQTLHLQAPFEEPFLLAVNEEGGTVRLPTVGRADSLWLLQGDIPLDRPILERWNQINGRWQGGNANTTFLRLAPGPYTVCNLSEAQFSRWALQGTAPPVSRCETGVLSPHGELELGFALTAPSG